MATVVDYSARPISAASVKNAGHIGAVRYLSDPRTPTMLGKPIRINEAFDYWNNGLQLAFVWQYGKEHNSDVKRGYNGGVEDAIKAAERMKQVGAKEQPVYFAVDFDIKLHEWNSYGVEYFKGAISVLGVQRVGIYGHSKVCAWAIEDGVIGKSSTPGKYWAWQTRSWSTPGVITEGVVLYQRIVDTPSRPGPKIDGVTVDVNDVLADDWGQNEVKPYVSTPFVKKEKFVLSAKQFKADVDVLGDNDSGWRNTNTIVQAFVHTVENPSDRDPVNVAKWQDSSNTGSYHILVGGDGKTVRSNDDDYIPWAAGWTANRIGLHLSCCGYSADSREKWLARDAQLRAVSRILADWCIRYNIEPVKLDPNQVRALKRGIAGHGDAAVAWRETDHTDPGPNFPWDVVIGYVKENIRGNSLNDKDDEDEMSALNEVHKSIVEGSTYEAPLKQFIVNTDGHAFVTRVNTEVLIKTQERILTTLTDLTKVLERIEKKLG